MSIFKACDIRGIYPDEIAEDQAFSIGRAIGTRLSGADCVLGGDLRPSTPGLKQAVLEGLCRAGARVIDLGLLPTPAVYWARRALGVAGAIIVTASHNPPQYNGVKFMLGERPAMPEDVAALEQAVRAGEFASGSGEVSRRDVRRAYVDWLRERFRGTGAGLKVLVDAGNGCAGQWAPHALRAAGFDVEELFCEPDGTFPNRSPNPSGPEVLGEASRLVRERHADFAAAFDGDADRVVFLDEQGAFVDGDRSIILFARDVLSRRPGAAIVYDIKCARAVAQQVRRAGGRPVRERSGYAFIKSRLLDENAAFAGEASGHFFFREIGGDDGIYAALRMGEILSACGQPFSRLLASVPQYNVSPDIRMPRPRGDGERVIQALSRVFADYPQDFTDGVRIEFGNGWALCRISVTEPVLTLRFEGDTPEVLEEIKRRVLAEIPE